MIKAKYRLLYEKYSTPKNPLECLSLPQKFVLENGLMLLLQALAFLIPKDLASSYLSFSSERIYPSNRLFHIAETW